MRLSLPFLLAGLVACSGDYNFATQEKEVQPAKDETGTWYEYPIAKCSVSPNPITPPFETATWDGRESYDPNGMEITEYQWSLVEKPAGSAVHMPDGEAVRQDFMPDLAGSYVGQLIVVNEIGETSDPCTVTLESVPAQNLWVEMYWTHAQDDMDLHLLAPNGNLRSNTDCYYENCVRRGLDWGEPRYDGDNPSLDLDDIPGVGPENINILDPEDATYTVYVNDYGSTRFTGDNEVTVNVYLNGSRVYTDTKTISGENEDVKFAEIDWSAGRVKGF